MTENAPQLSQIAGRYREWAPVAALREHVRCLWVNDLSHSPVTLVQVVPDGCVDIIWTRDGICVAGPDTRPILANLPSRGFVAGARFHPGAALSWLGIWTRAATRLEDELSQAVDPAAVPGCIELALLARLPQVGPADRSIAFLRNVVCEDRGGGHLRMPRLAGQMGLSERTLHRRCVDVFGYGLKTLHCIVRFQRFFSLALHSANYRLVELGIEAGFADQAHLTREVQRLGGTTPSQFVAQLRE
jgi:AraC-like DNA-binding protein